MSENIFKPLGMLSSAPYKIPAFREKLAVNYTAEKAIIPHNIYMPSGGLGYCSTAHDILKYGIFFSGRKLKNQKQILSEKTINLILTPFENKKFPEKLGSFGWGAADLGDNLIWNITNGRIGGANATLSIVPSRGIVVVCLANITSSQITDMTALQITDVLIPGFLNKCKKKIEDYESKFRPKPYSPKPEFLGKWKGEIKGIKKIFL